MNSIQRREGGHGFQPLRGVLFLTSLAQGTAVVLAHVLVAPLS
jgi:hypothetical protein